MSILNNIVGYSFTGFVIFFLILLDVFWSEKKKFEKINGETKVKTIWVLSAIDGFFFLVFIVSLIIKLINILFN